MANTPAVLRFEKEIAVGATSTSSYNLTKGWKKISVAIPTMIARSVTAACKVIIKASENEDGPFRMIYNGGRKEEYITDDNPPKLFYQFCEDPSSNIQMTGDYSGTTTLFSIGPSAGEQYHLNRMIIHYEDTFNWNSSEYGNLGGPLTDGIRIDIRDGNNSSVLDITNGTPIRTNGQWARFCHDYTYINHGVGTDLASVRWSFFKAGQPIVLNGDSGDKLVIEVSDDLDGLNDHTAQVQGWINTNPPSVPRVVDVPSNYQYYKIETGYQVTATATFTLICSD